MLHRLYDFEVQIIFQRWQGPRFLAGNKSVGEQNDEGEGLGLFS
jgi:hypothetical protein